MKRRIERRESCDRCLAMKIREDMGSRGSDIEPMPSRAYHQIQDDHLRKWPTAMSPTAISPTAISPTDQRWTDHKRNPPAPPTAVSPDVASPVFTEILPYPPIGAMFHELDVERDHIPYPPSRPQGPQYQFDESDDEDVTPPTPPPKPHYRELEDRPRVPRLDVGSFEAPYRPARRQDARQDEPKLGAPGRAYSISSYYYSNQNAF